MKNNERDRFFSHKQKQENAEEENKNTTILFTKTLKHNKEVQITYFPWKLTQQSTTRAYELTKMMMKFRFKCTNWTQTTCVQRMFEKM